MAVVQPAAQRRLSTPTLVVLVFVIWLVPQFAAVFIVPGLVDGPSYDSVKGIVQLELLPKAGTALLAAWLIVKLGWWNDVWRERFTVERWVLVVPVGMVVVALATTDVANLVSAGLGMTALLAVTVAFTGINEELVFRGLALRALRDRHTEVRAAVWSSVFFGLFHLVNIVTDGGAAVLQSIWAISAGYLLYLCRRVGGGIALAMVVHAIWDFGSFSPFLANSEALAAGRTFLQFLSVLILLIVVIVRRRAIPATPRELSLPPPPAAAPAPG
ncbi:MAG: CPBP family intramembrane metalloprotease [Acidimicrobiales bacterium]|nr:CPBP family intramembrane metalloprotease [Acidimicrobiales bacterium]